MLNASTKGTQLRLTRTHAKAQVATDASTLYSRFSRPTKWSATFSSCLDIVYMGSHIGYMSYMGIVYMLKSHEISWACQATSFTSAPRGTPPCKYIQNKCKCCSSSKVSYDGIQRIQRYPLCTGRGLLPSEFRWPVSIRCAPHDWNAMKSPVNVQRYQNVAM